MQLKKIFFPIGGGEELAERIHGALLVNKFFGAHINIMACQLDPKMIYNVRMTLKGGVLMEEFLKSAGDEMQAEREEIRAIFDAECAKLGLDQSDDDHVPNSAALRPMVGIRSELVEKYSKYCDLVLVSVPPTGSITGTFEAAVTKSGKPCIVIPRKLQEFRADKILVSLTGTAASARALDNSLELLQCAKSVTVITANQSKRLRKSTFILSIRKSKGINGLYRGGRGWTTAGKASRRTYGRGTRRPAPTVPGRHSAPQAA